MILFLSLPLLVLRVGADNADHTVAVDHFALITQFLYGCPYLHDSFQTAPNAASSSKLRLAEKRGLIVKNFGSLKNAASFFQKF